MMKRWMGIPAILGAFLWLVAAPPAVFADPIEDAVKVMSQKLAAKPALKGKKIGVLDFPSDGGERLSKLGVQLAEMLDAELSRLAAKHGFTLVERRQLENLKKEWGLWTTDTVSASEAQQLGNLNGMHVAILGSVNDWVDRGFRLSVRPIETATGVNLGAEDTMISRDKSVTLLFGETVGRRGQGPSVARPATPPAPAVPTETAALPPVVPVIPVKLLTAELWTENQKIRFRLGENIRFQFKTNRDAYVTLINVSANGAMSILYPNAFSPDNFVKAGQTVSIPSEKDGFSFVLHGEPGAEIIRLLATEEPVDWRFQSLPQQPGPFQVFNKREVVIQAAQNISAKKALIDPAKIGEALLRIEVQP